MVVVLPVVVLYYVVNCCHSTQKKFGSCWTKITPLMLDPYIAQGLYLGTPIQFLSITAISTQTTLSTYYQGLVNFNLKQVESVSSN